MKDLNEEEKDNIISFEEVSEEIIDKNGKKFERANKKAKELLENEDKMERFLQRLEKKLKTIPVAGNSLSYVPTLISLVRNYVKKEYGEIPIGSIIAIVAALVYVLSPVDIIPDILPGGWVDDALVITACLTLVRTDVEDYKKWRKEKGLVVEDLPNYEEIHKDSEKVNKIAKFFFKNTDKKE